MATTGPRFRADHVGSLLRPPAVTAAREALASGTGSAEDLRAAEDAAVRELVARQEAVGLPASTDGEVRRTTWHFDFISELGGIVPAPGNVVVRFENEHDTIEWTPTAFRIDGRLHLDHPIFADAFGFLRSVVDRSVAKLTIPSPSMVHYRGGQAALEGSDYSSMEEFYADLSAVYRAEIAALYDAGCRYLQLDDTALAGLNDPAQRAAIAAAGGDPDHQHERYISIINDAVADRPDDLLLTTHLCRGNYRSSWSASGSYDFVAEALFGTLDVDGFFLEFDDERSGGFEPLRYVADDRFVVLGLVTSKRPELESPDQLKARIEQAASYLDLDRLCLSPQCGFASTLEGNALSEDDQWAKLELVVSVAADVWG